MRRTACVLISALALSGCATSSLFKPYPSQAQQWRSATLSSQQAQELVATLEKKTDSKDGLLYLQEQGRVAQIGGLVDSSQQAFERAIDLYLAQDDKALISAGALAGGLSTTLSNDNAMAYSGYEYERIALHGFQALNFWQHGDLSGAAVEFRRLTQEQRNAEVRNDKRIAKAEAEAEKEGSPSANDLDSQLGGLNSAASSVRNSIQNAYFYYLAGVFREGTGQFNDATVDFKKAYEIMPRHPLLEADIRRLTARQTGRYRAASGSGQVVIAYEQGYIPARQQISLPIPTVHGYFAVAFPTYAGNAPEPRPLQISGAGHATTAVIARFDGLAARALKEQVPGMLLRQTLRAKAKYETQKLANDKGGVFAGLATQIYNLVSEQADLRSWLTLPANAQVARLELPAGTQALTLAGMGSSTSVDVPVTAGGTTLVRVIDTGALHVTVLPTLENRR
ncbi:COG3014 family protein [Isoalcanivorax beigongshangi]|uniref:COG3014 family protein n=1 Tax=Isoalcanivorax beigongshangi TaxID=3238810 RepID=A0ABV4AM59_9GAMM